LEPAIFEALRRFETENNVRLRAPGCGCCSDGEELLIYARGVGGEPLRAYRDGADDLTADPEARYQ
jgi:hypothetical protein